MRRYEWILFDADHTLFDFDKASEEALSEVLLEYGVSWCAGMYGDYKRINIQCWSEHENGLINRDTLVYERFRRYFDHMKLGLDPVTTQQKYLKGLGSKPYTMPGAEIMLMQIKSTRKIGYITNGMTEVQRIRLDLVGWTSWFDLIVIAGEIGCSKPHKEYFDHVHRHMGFPDKEKVLVVGDSLSADIRGALNFGYHACWYNPDQQECLPELAPQHMISHLEELFHVVQD
jgi:YjjG family noncanonical pyrimidine nucleotidase